MRIGFIVCEYNPLHNGHVNHIKISKEEMNCDKIVCIMSGDIVQRGEFAIKDKYTRAEWAIKAGCDMVVELPVEYTLGSAQVFATGAAKVIDLFDCEKYMSFGSECGSVYVLEKIAEMITSKECNEYLKEFLDQGNSYAKSESLAFEKYLDEHKIDKSIAKIIQEPNNILGLEYIKAIHEMAVTPFTVKREASYSDSLSTSAPSAMSIRELLYKGESAKDYVPDYVLKDLVDVKDNREKLFSVIKYELSKKDNTDKIFGMNEGIHNRFKSFLSKSETYEEYMNNVKTKRFTMTSLARALMCALIDNTYTFDEVMNNDIEYLNVLAIKEDAKKLLSVPEIELVTKPSELKHLEETKHVHSEIQKKSEILFKSINYEYEPYMRIVK